MPSLSDTIELATYLHDGVTDCTGVPYITHPMWVMNALPTNVTDDDRHLALLHDTVEDCKARIVELMRKEMQSDASRDIMEYTADDIETLFEFYRHRDYSEYLINGLRLLTRDRWPKLTYLDHIRQIAASGHGGAIFVKYFDNCHNSDPTRISQVLPCFTDRVVGLQKRYAKSKQILQSALESK